MHSMEKKKFLLQESDIPQAWYNVIPDMATKFIQEQRNHLVWMI